MQSHSSHAAPVQYGVAILAVAFVAALRWTLGTYLAGNSPLLPFTLAVVVAACVGGRLPGLVATLLSGLIGEYLFLPHTRPFFLATPEDMIDLAGFLFIGTGISLLIHRLHTARVRSDECRETALADEEKLRLLTDSVQDYTLALLDADGRFISWNPAGLRILGYPHGDILGRHYCCLYSDAATEAGEPQLDLDTAATLGRCERRDQRVRRDGSPLHAHTVLTAIHADDGQLRGFAVVLREMLLKHGPRSLSGLADEHRSAVSIASV